MGNDDKTRDPSISEVKGLGRNPADKPDLGTIGCTSKIPFGDQLRKKAEVQLEDEACVLPPTFAAEYAKKLIHELRVHETELEMQNEELRRVQNDLEITRSRYADLYDFAPVGYLTLNKHGQIDNLNLTAAMQLGIERVHLINKHFQYFVAQPDKKDFFSHLNGIFDKRKRQITEVRLTRKGGEQFHARLESIYIEGEDGAGLCRTNMSDVTLRKRAEEEQQNTRNELRVLALKRTAEIADSNECLKLEIAEREKIEEELRKSQDELDLRVQERTAELKKANEELRQIPSKLIAVLEEERTRLASELHDSIGQTLAAMKFRIEMVLKIRDEGDGSTALNHLEQFVPILQRSIVSGKAIETH